MSSRPTHPPDPFQSPLTDDRLTRLIETPSTPSPAAELLNQQNVLSSSAIELSSTPFVTAPSTTPTTATDSSISTSRPSTASTTPRMPTSHLQFRSHTIAPSPPQPRSDDTVSITSAHQPAEQTSGSLHLTPSRLTTEIHLATPTAIDIPHSFTTPSRSPNRPSLTLHHKASASSLRPISRTPSLKTGSLNSVFGTASATSSAYPSPVISAMGDVTPLPSPLLADSPGPWKRLNKRSSRDGAPPGSPGDLMASTPTRRKGYAGLSLGPPAEGGISKGLKQNAEPKEQGQQQHEQQQQPPTHGRNRSVSEYIPDPMLVPKRMVTVSGSHVKAEVGESHMRREPHLSEARGLTPIEKPPTPPPSESSQSANDSGSSAESGTRSRAKSSTDEFFEAIGRRDRKKRRWRSIKMLGQGTFSRVMLATSQISSSASDDDDYASSTISAASGLHTPEPVPQYKRRTLVAVKVCEHGPRGGASEERIEMSLKRELEIMLLIHHPSLIHLKAWNIEPSRAILVLSYCPGGDLFDVASGHRDLLGPRLLQRIFAEIVGAVRYLHDHKIVHRDIKLENVLVNLTPAELCSTTTDWATYPYSVITVTDLGLSRRVADDERLETRCGSDDYAAPEVIMGQPYDGRAIDAWSLGVLLYALLESRLPFDPHPGVGDHAMQMRMRSRTSHRIARVEWRWIEYGVRDGEGDGDGDHEADIRRFDAKGLRGAMEVVEGLLKRARSRWPLEKVAETEWVRGGINVDGGIKFREEEEGEEVS